MSFEQKVFSDRVAVLKPENLQIVITSAEKRTETDSYEGGCDLDSTKTKSLKFGGFVFPTPLEAFRAIVKDKSITPDRITTFDPNIYSDNKGGVRTVQDYTAQGCFRCIYDRQENERGQVPTAQEMADFEAGKIDLKQASYEIYFNVMLVGLAEDNLATLLGVNNW